MNLIIREMKKEEYPLLEKFLCEAVCRTPKSVPIPESVVHHPSLRICIESFACCRGDLCLCAESGGGRSVGAAWTRLMQGFGHVEDATPELAMAVLAPYRGQGIGTALLSAMQERLKKNGVPGLSLSVQKKNPVVHLYRKSNFTIQRETEEELVMEHRF